MRWIYGVGGAVIVFTFLSDLWWAINYELAANWSLTVLTVCVTVFTVLYAARSNWKANPIGAILLAKSIFLTVTLWQIVASVWVSTEYPFRQQIRFVIYALGALAYITMVVSLWRYQHQDRSALRRQKVI
jgi:hypothetical protein